MERKRFEELKKMGRLDESCEPIDEGLLPSGTQRRGSSAWLMAARRRAADPSLSYAERKKAKDAVVYWTKKVRSEKRKAKMHYGKPGHPTKRQTPAREIQRGQSFKDRMARIKAEEE